MVIKIEGDYHGNTDVLLYDIPGADAKHLNRRPTPGSKGLPAFTSDLVFTVRFNDSDTIGTILKKHRGKIAAVFMEPILGNTAAIMPKPGYLQAVRSLCDEYGVILVFDEVKTGFRVSRGGAQEYFGVYSDLTMLGKAIANGFPLAAIGGKRELMQLIKPGSVHHCGTYFGNLPCTAAANAVLSTLSTIDYRPLMLRGERLAKGICDLLTNASIPAHWHGVGSMFGITVGPEKPRDYRTWWLHTERKLWMDIVTRLRKLGVLADGFIGLFFLSFAHTDEHIDQTLSLCKKAIKLCKHRM
jgi:glutamate-1-semialdehyde 2,1-aminomutase